NVGFAAITATTGDSVARHFRFQPISIPFEPMKRTQASRRDALMSPAESHAGDANMTRMLFAMVVGFASMGSARADWGGSTPPNPNPNYPVQPIRSEFTAPNTLMGLGHAHDGKAPDRYGLMPGLRKAFRVDGGGGCSTCGGAKSGVL